MPRKIRYPKRSVYCTDRKTITRSLPFTELYSDGLMRCTASTKMGDVNTYSMLYRIIDTNYESSDDAEQQRLLQSWYGILNIFDSKTALQIIMINRTPSKDILDATTHIPLKEDKYDSDRIELNEMMDKKMKLAGKRKVFREKYFVISSEHRTKEDADRYYARIKSELKTGFMRMGSDIAQLGEIERAKLMHDVYRQGSEDEFWFDPEIVKKNGHSVKECVCPFKFEIKDDYMKIGAKYAQAIMLYQYPQFAEDVIVKKMTDIEKNMILTINLVPIERQDALDQISTVYTNIEADIAKFTRKQVANKNYNAQIPIKTQEKRERIIDLRNDIANRDQGIFFFNLSAVIFGDTEEDMRDAAQTVCEVGRQKQAHFIINEYQQEDTFNTCMPFGLRFTENNSWHTFTSESVAAFNPFVARELLQKGGLYYGNHSITGTPIIGNRDLLDNGNAIIVGASGKGKSMFSKEEMIQIFLRGDEKTDIIIIDPEREFKRICKRYDGANIVLSSNSKCHINPMKLADASLLDSDDKPIPLKIEFMQTIFEQLLGKDMINNAQKSIIDRGLRLTYKNAGKNEPTLQDFFNIIKNMDLEEARMLALDLERFIEGSLDTFAHKSNVDMDNRFTVYDIHELGAGLKDVGMSIMLDAVFAKVARNRASGRKTIIYVDEFWIMMKHEQSAKYIDDMWRRFRKYGAWVTGITQNLQDLMNCEEGRSIINNATIAVMLGQQEKEVQLLRDAYKLSESQCLYITDSLPGHGLLKFGDAYIPFDNEFDKTLSMYRDMTTNQMELRAFNLDEDDDETDDVAIIDTDDNETEETAEEENDNTEETENVSEEKSKKHYKTVETADDWL